MIFRHCKIIAVFIHDCDSLRFLYMSTVASAKKKNVENNGKHNNNNSEMI